jgi:hypothetical protein
MVLGAFLEGWRRVVRAPAVVLGVLLATLLFALPLAFALSGMIEQHFGSSLEAERAWGNWKPGWATEFAQQSQGIGRTFTYEILGFGGSLATASNFIDNVPLNPTIAGAAAAYVLLWVFIWGGILDRIARARPVRTGAFFSACGVYFFRFLRLGVITGAVYWALFRWLHPYLFETLYNQWTSDLTVEKTALVLRAVLYGIFLVALMLVSLVVDYAKVRVVVEDRRSMTGAIVAAVRFIRRRPFRTLGLYLLNVVALLVVVRLWLPAAPAATAQVWSAMLITQIYLLLRVMAKLSFLSSEVVFFQGELSHAGHTAAPLPIWPESPAAEAMSNLVARRDVER